MQPQQQTLIKIIIQIPKTNSVNSINSDISSKVKIKKKKSEVFEVNIF